jgi:hypothetical protein
MNPSLALIVSCSSYKEQLRAFLRHIEETQPTEKIELFLCGWEGIDYASLTTQPFFSVKECVFKRSEGLKVGLKHAVHLATADIVLFLEDHTRLLGNWTDSLPVLFSDPAIGAVGWTVEPYNKSNSASWAAYFVEYGLWGPGQQAGVTQQLIPGHNTAYRRNALLELEPNLYFYLLAEMFLQQHLLEKNYKLYFCPDIVLQHQQYLQYSNFLVANFWYGWAFASTRHITKRWNYPHRLLFALAIGLKPFIRWKILLQRSQIPGYYPRTLLWKHWFGISAGYAIGALGESVGYIAGTGIEEIPITKYEIGYYRNPE